MSNEQEDVWSSAEFHIYELDILAIVKALEKICVYISS